MQIVSITGAAAAAVREYLGDVAVLRVAVEGDNVEGYSYLLDAARGAYAADESRDIIQAAGGYTVAIRCEQAPYLLGTTIDYVTAPIPGFRFDNPNVKRTL
jgi:Fe-S cluster assembly iron-binding protein IscA